MSKSLDPVNRCLSMQEQGAGRKKGMHGMEFRQQVTRQPRNCSWLEAGALCWDKYKEFKVHKIAVMTGSSLNHPCAATEHVSGAINHSWQDVNTPVWGLKGCPAQCTKWYFAAGKRALLVWVLSILLSPRGHGTSGGPGEQAANPARQGNTTSLWDSRILFNLWTPHKLINWSYIHNHKKHPSPNLCYATYGSTVKKKQRVWGMSEQALQEGGAEGMLSELPLERSFRGCKENMHAQISHIDL